MGKKPCLPKVQDFEQWATRELRRMLERSGWEDWEQYRVQVLFNASEPVCRTAEQQARERKVAEQLVRGMGLPLELLGVEDEPDVKGAGHVE